jgi:integrase
LKATRKSGVPGVFEVMARGFTEEFGKLRVRELQPHMVEDYIARQSHRWNSTSQCHAGQLILGAVSWARKKGFIATDPLRGRVDLPAPILRGREARMSEELMDLLIEESSKNQHKSTEFGELLWVLRQTGARPGEIRHAEAFNYEKGKLVFRWNATKGYIWKNAKRTQRDRVIFLTPEVQAHVEKLIAANPSGPIFRTPRDASWSLTSVCNKWRWLLKRPRVIASCKQHGIEIGSLKMYNFRHSWACNYLDTTGDIFGAALMLGTSVKMLQQRYFHMDMDRLHEKYLAYMGKPPTVQGI